MRKNGKSHFDSQVIDKNIIESERIDKNFINDFIRYWEVFKDFVPKTSKRISWEHWREICKKQLLVETKPFYEKWKNSGLLKWGPYIETYYSFTLNVKAGYIIIPYRFLLYDSYYPTNTTFDMLKQDPSENTYNRAISHLCLDLNIEFRKPEIGIIQKIAQPQFSKSLERFPTKKELTYGLRYRDERTTKKAMDFLLWNSILIPIYLVDMSKIGYITELFIHQKRIKEIPEDIKAHFALSFPLNSLNNHVSVIQYPSKSIDKLKRIEEFLQPTRIMKLNKQLRGWNLEGLTPTRRNRWQLRPPIIEGIDLTRRIITGRSGIEHSLDTYFEPYKLHHLEARLLGLVHKMSSLSEKVLMKELNVGREYLIRTWKKLLQNQVISRFSIFGNIGLGGWIHFMVKGTGEIGNIVTSNIIRHLDFLPYKNVYNSNTDGLLLGSVNLPPHWIRNFLCRLAELPSLVDGLEYFYYIGPEVHEPWGLNLVNTYNWGDKTANQD